MSAVESAAASSKSIWVSTVEPGLSGEALLQPPAPGERLQRCCGTDQLTGLRVLGELGEAGAGYPSPP